MTKLRKIICLHGGPGSGKSTTAAGVFYLAKKSGINAEMNLEYYKYWQWEDRKIKQGDQTYFFSKMSRRERILMEKGLELIVTDSPLILTHFYGIMYDHFEQTSNTSLVMLKHHHEVCKYYEYKIDHYLIKRSKDYVQLGRNESEEVAKSYDDEIKKLLNESNIKYSELNYDNAAETIVNKIINER